MRPLPLCAALVCPWAWVAFGRCLDAAGRLFGAEALVYWRTDTDTETDNDTDADAGIDTDTDTDIYTDTNACTDTDTEIQSTNK